MTTISFVGAGSAVFTRQLLRDLLSYDDLGPLTLVLHDIDERRLRLAHDVARLTVDHHGRRAEVRAEADRRTALEGADFVVNTVNVGGHAATLTDFEVPARFGVRQTIADTLGVGGVFRALRTFPVLDGLARDIQEVCPDAWLLNYTNPMAMNLQYLAARHPGVKALGLCHSVYWTVHDLCELVGVPLEEVTFHSAGVNHQAWVLRWERAGESLYPLLDERDRGRPGATTTRARRHVPAAGLLPDRDQRTLQRVRAVVPARRGRDRAAEDPGRRLRRDQRRQRRRDRGARADRRRGPVRRARRGGGRVRASGGAQPGHGHAPHHPGDGPEPGARAQPADRSRRRGAVPARCRGRPTVGRGRPAGRLRGPEPALPLGGRADRAGRRRGTSGAGPAGADGRPQHSGHAVASMRSGTWPTRWSPPMGRCFPRHCGRRSGSRVSPAERSGGVDQMDLDPPTAQSIDGVG